MRVVLVDILALVDHNRPDVLLERVEVEPSIMTGISARPEELLPRQLAECLLRREYAEPPSTAPSDALLARCNRPSRAAMRAG